MWKSTYLHLSEALEIVAERVGLRPPETNPVKKALRENALGGEARFRTYAEDFSSGVIESDWEPFDRWTELNIQDGHTHFGWGMRWTSEGAIRLLRSDVDNLFPPEEPENHEVYRTPPATQPTSAHEPQQAESYLSPFLELMIEASRRFQICPEPLRGAEWLKKEVLVEHFLGLEIPGVGPLSRSQAESMATFCRPPNFMRGGNRRQD